MELAFFFVADIMFTPNIGKVEHYVQHGIYAEAENYEIEFDYQNKQAITNKKHSERNKLAGDCLLKAAEENTDKVDKSLDLSTEAANEYIKSTEKILKAAFHACHASDDKGILRTHNIVTLHNCLKKERVELISSEDAKKMNDCHGGAGLAYIATEYGDKNGKTITIPIDETKEIKRITEKAHRNYNEFEKKEKSRKIVESVFKL